MEDLTDIVVSETFAECPDHTGAHLYRMEGAAGETYWRCPFVGCDPLHDSDVYLEWNERHDGQHDGIGIALHITELQPSDD